MKIARIALRNIARNGRRSILSGSAIAVAGFAIVFLFSFLAGMIDDMENNLWTYMTGAVRVRNKEFDKYERLNPMHLAIPGYEELIAEIEADPAVSAVSPRIKFPGRITKDDGAKVDVLGFGVDFDREASYQDYGRTLVEGRLPGKGTREALVGSSLAKKLGIGVGGKFTVLSQSGTRGSNAVTYTAVGLLSLPVPGLETAMVQVPLETVQRLLWLPDQVQEILIKVDTDIASPETAAERLGERLESEVPLNVWEYKRINGMASIMDLASRLYDIIGIAFFFLASTVIVNTTIMVIFERMNEIGTLGAMGMTGGQLERLFFLEALFIGIAGAVVGVAAGIALTAYFGAVGFTAFAEAMEGMDDMGVSGVIYPVLGFKSTVVVFLYSLVVTALATWWPSRRAARITPVEALRHV
jgi:putative ABC transport system permease protein